MKTLYHVMYDPVEDKQYIRFHSLEFTSIGFRFENDEGKILSWRDMKNLQVLVKVAGL